MKGTKDKKTIERLQAKVAILHEAALNVVCPDPENTVGDNNRNWTILEQLTANAAFETSHYIYQCRKDQEALTKAALIARLEVANGHTLYSKILNDVHTVEAER
jgi:hypothetical protein